MSHGGILAFGPFRLDTKARRLTRDGTPVALGARQFDLLHILVAKAGHVISKDALIEVAWRDVAVTDNSLEQAISSLRRALGPSGGHAYIETQARRGYRFVGDVTRLETRETDEALDALLAPHRAWLEGRAALETLERDHILHARQVFEAVLSTVPDQASAHVGLANACAMQFEMTRVDEVPDTDALRRAAHHAREACRLDAEYGEGWATLGFVLDRTGEHTEALAALRRAVALEPDNWRHHVRLSYAGWGEERLREARRTLALLPGFPLAHLLAATVHVARQAFSEAERELVAGIAAENTQAIMQARFGGVALHWLLGLIYLARGDEARALAEFDRELSFEASGHLYARECSANTWYAIGAVRLRQRRLEDARAAFSRALERVPMHLMARAGLLAAGPHGGLAAGEGGDRLEGRISSVDAAICAAARLVATDHTFEAARLVDDALKEAVPGNSGWLLPVEPLLRLQPDANVWAATLARLRSRAA